MIIAVNKTSLSPEAAVATSLPPWYDSALTETEEIIDSMSSSLLFVQR